MLPLIDDYVEAGVDVLIGVDPVQGTHTDLANQGANCRASSVCGAASQVQSRSKWVKRARFASRRAKFAIAALGPQGFILSPVDNITVDAPQDLE